MAWSIVTGMPQLCRAGLSENWLWKECGHRHWLALAHSFGMERPDFRHETGDRLYPAFTAVSLIDGRLNEVVEDQHLAFAVDLSRISRTQFRSRIAVTADDRPVATLEMSSIFLRRRIAGRNKSVERGLARQHCALAPESDFDTAGQAWRAGTWTSHMGFDVAKRGDIASLGFDPTPHEDFNGADFLYFASFQVMLDRAEWSWLRSTDRLMTTIRRDIAYRGNIELGDTLTLRLCALRQEADRLAHWIEIRRDSDDMRIAEAITVRAS
jgi:probable biosynthetic protein (TIGR04099 family)